MCNNPFRYGGSALVRPERRLEVTDGAVLAALAHPLRVALLYQLQRVRVAHGQPVRPGAGRRRPTAATTCASWPRWGWSPGTRPATGGAALAVGLHRLGLLGRRRRPRGRDGSPGDQGIAAQSRDHRAPGPPVLPALEPRASKPWRDAATVNSYSLRLTAAELASLVEALDAAIRPFIGLTRSDPPEGAEPVHLDLKAFLRPETLAVKAGWALLRRRTSGCCGPVGSSRRRATGSCWSGCRCGSFR